MTTEHDFIAQLMELTSDIAGRPLDQNLATYLNDRYGQQTVVYKSLSAACKEGVEEGWLANRQAAPGLKFSRPMKPGPDSNGFSVDVVEMIDLAGPHHSHPNGEIDMIMPIDSTAEFDGMGAGWLVYGPGSAHHPTVANGKAIILYLLPDGAIEFTKQQ